MNRWVFSKGSYMRSPAGSSKEGQAVVVHGSVAALVLQPDGYEIEIRWWAT